MEDRSASSAELRSWPSSRPHIAHCCVYNSILAFNPSSSQDDTCPEPGLFDAIEYSLLTDARCGAAGEQGNLVGDPQFVAPQQGNYHLAATSPAIDHDQPQAAPSLDFENDARPCHPPAAGEERPDMGCDEYSQGYVCYSAVKSVYLPLIYR